MSCTSLLRLAGVVGLLAWQTNGVQAQQAFGTAPSLSLAVQTDAPIPIKGVVNMDAAGGGAGGMLYPAPGLLGLVVSVATHSVLADSAQRSERARIEEEADKVAVRYRAASAGFLQQNLLQAVVTLPGYQSSGAPLVPVGHAPQDHPMVVVSPTYTISQDERGLILDASMQWRRPGQAEPVSMQMRAVGQPLDAQDVGKAWLTEGGAGFRKDAAVLLARIIDASFRQLTESAGAATVAEQQTVRYWVGGTRRVERAVPLSSGCGYRAYRTLRSEILVVPSGNSDGCPQAVVADQR